MPAQDLGQGGWHRFEELMKGLLKHAVEEVNDIY